MPLDPSIPLQAAGAPDNSGKLMQFAQMQQMGQQRQQQADQQAAALREHKRVKAMAERGTGLFMRYQTLKDNGFSEQAAHAAMQEDYQRDIGGLASLRDDNGQALFSQEELGQFGQEFNAGQLGQILPQLMGADKALDAHFKAREATDKRQHQAGALAETRRHNQAVEGQPKAGQRPVPVADPKSATGFTYQTPDGAVGQPAPAPRAQNNTRYSAKELQAARDKTRVIGLAKQQLAKLKQSRDKIKDTLASGPGFLPGAMSSDASNFDGDVDTMRDTITAITRTPGVGAMSDFETRLNQAKLPTRNEFESTRDRKIQAMEDMLNTLEASYGDILSDGQESAPTAGQELDDIMGAADAILDGQ